jgi:seryl-tRNA synthetase
LQSIETQQPQEEQMPQIPETSLPEGYYEQQYSSEEYIDYLVQQRVAEVTEKMNEFQKRYQEMQEKISELTSELKAVSVKTSPLQSQMMNKMDSFTESITDVNNRLSGLEKAFKETLPSLIDSVRALSDLVQRVRKEQA